MDRNATLLVKLDGCGWDDVAETLPFSLIPLSKSVFPVKDRWIRDRFMAFLLVLLPLLVAVSIVLIVLVSALVVPVDVVGFSTGLTRRCVVWPFVQYSCCGNADGYCSARLLYRSELFSVKRLRVYT